MRVRTLRQARILGNSGKAIVKSSSIAGVRQIRCPRCQQMCGPQMRPDGKEVYRCMACSAEFTCVQMDRPA